MPPVEIPNRPQSPVAHRFFTKALVWFVPALLVLPFYVILLAIMAAGNDGQAASSMDGFRGGINTALGPLLVVVGIGIGIVGAALGHDLEAALTGVAVGLGCILFGFEFSRRAWKDLARH